MMLIKPNINIMLLKTAKHQQLLLFYLQMGILNSESLFLINKNK